MANQPDKYGGDGSYTDPSLPPSGHRAGYARTSSGASDLILQGTDDEKRETLRRTLESLSSDQQRDLMGVYKECSREVALTRALPFAGIVVGSLYLAKRQLPPPMQLFGNRWPFYVAAGMSAFMVGQLLSFDKCNQRAKEYLFKLSAQTEDASPLPFQPEGAPQEMPARGDLTYDDLREQNREQYRKQRAVARHPRPVDPSRPQYPSTPLGDQPAPPMSGTTGKGTSYGDTDFS